MSEVKKPIKRYSRDFDVRLVEDPNGAWVLHSDAWQLNNELDAQRLRADTAEAELKDIKDGMAYRGSLFGKVQSERDDYERKLAAAEQRIAERDELIADVLKAFQLNAEGRGSCINPGITFIQPWAERVAALNQKSEGESQ